MSNPKENSVPPKITVPVVDLSQFKNSGPVGQQRPTQPVMAFTGTLIFADGSSTGVTFLAADPRGLLINIGNIKQQVQGQS